MKRFLVICFALILVLSGCANNMPQNEPKTEQKEMIEADLASLRDTIITELSIEEPIFIESADLFDLYGIAEDKILQSAGFVTMDGTFPHEIIMTEAKDSASADAIENLLNTRLNEVLLQSKSYDAENYALAQKCKVVRNDNFVCVFLSPFEEKMLEIYSASVK